MGYRRRVQQAGLVALVAALVVILTEPVPEGFSHPWRVKFVLVGVRHGMWVSSVAASLGIAERGWFIRTFTDLLAPHSTDPRVQVTREMFDGVPVQLLTPRDPPQADPPQADPPQADPPQADPPRADPPQADPPQADPPQAAPTRHRGVVFLHGGGWVLGSPESHSPITMYLAANIPAVIASVDYRMAPEHLFPVPFDDCLKAVKHFLQNAEKYNVDPQSIVIAGDSAGGNLAAAVNLALRDEKFPLRPAGQVLAYPVTQFVDLNTPSYQQNRKGPFLPAHEMPWFMQAYTTGKFDLSDIILNNSHVSPEARDLISRDFMNHDNIPEELKYAPYTEPTNPHGNRQVWEELKSTFFNPYVSPLVAETLHDQPKTYIYTCNYDVLRDDGTLYAWRLKEAGNDVTLYNDRVCMHGKLSFVVTDIPEAHKDLDNIVKFIRTCPTS